MKITRDEKEGCARLLLEGEMNIYEAGAVREALLKGFESRDGVILDLGSVTECDTAAVQLLCAARVTADADGKRFDVERLSDVVRSAIEAVGLTPEKVFDMSEEVV